MTFNMPELIVESVLREGFAGLKRKPELIDHVFASLTRSYASTKYGQKELARIRKLICERDWSFVHSFGEVETNAPCISIQLGSETEDKQVAHLDDYEETVIHEFTEDDADKLAELVRVSNIQPSSYDQTTGIIKVPDSVNLTQVYANLLYEDAAGNSFKIVGGIDNVDGQKQFMVEAGSDVDISDVGTIKSSIDYEQFEVRGVHNDVQIVVGVHTKDALMTKYIYVLVKYILLARKKALIERGLICSSWQGTEFLRNLKYEADVVYNRFLTLHGKVQDSWRSDQTDIFDNIDLKVLVPKDQATTEDLDKEEQTVQVGTTPQE